VLTIKQSDILHSSWSNKMKNKTPHYRYTSTIQYKNRRKRQNLTHKYMTTHSPGLVQELQ